MKCKGREPMGSKKHGKSGHAGKSPRMRLWLKREAEKRTSTKRKRTTKMFDSVKEAFNNG